MTKNFKWSGAHGRLRPFDVAARRIGNIDYRIAEEQRRKIEAQKRRDAQIDAVFDKLEDILTLQWARKKHGKTGPAAKNGTKSPKQR